MREELSDLLVGAMIVLFGTIGIILAAHARDDEMTVFGYSLAAWAACFVVGLIRRHYDEVDAAHHAAASGAIKAAE